MRASRRQRWRSDQGETLVELLVAISILGIAGVAIMAGLELSVKSSDIGRKQASGGSYVRSLGEAIQNSVAAGGYVKCGNYATPGNKTQARIPADYAIAQTSVKFWNGTSWMPCTTQGVDNGAQQIALSVTSPGDATHRAVERLTIIVHNPCSGALPNPC